MVNALADPLKLSPEAVRILVEKKINNIHTPPNAYKLKDVFTFLGLELSADEKKTIDFRNRTLHGRRMKESSLAAVAEETRRFDVLRTLINKGCCGSSTTTGPTWIAAPRHRPKVSRSRFSRSGSSPSPRLLNKTSPESPGASLCGR